MSGISSDEVTALLVKWSEGDDKALEQLTPLVYGDLRKLASWMLRGERPNHTLQPTALVNEAYLRLAGDKKITWQNRTHFFAVASRVMRHILVDSARQHKREKRGGGADALPLNEALVFTPEVSTDLLALNDALERLTKRDLRKARVVELRYFGGLSLEEIGAILHISPNTVTRDWDFAKTWLRKEISNGVHRAGREVEEN
jgi:RNA polymerase sigma factor (TIGR02999 family)